MTRPDIPVTIGGDPRAFEVALARVRALAKSSASDVMASFARLKTLAGGPLALASALGLTGLVSIARDTASAVAEIGDAARMAGLSGKAFQEWKYVAEQARIPIDAITDGLKELSLRADEFATTGSGSAAEAFKRLGMSQDEVKERLQNPSELLITLIERTRQLGDTAAGIRIFDELLGGAGGERMVALIDQGEAGIRSQIKAANDFGQILSDEVIANAQEIDRQFNAISQTVGVNLKSAIVSVVASMMDFLESLRNVENQRSSTIQSRINDIMAEKQEIAQKIREIDAADSVLNERQKGRARAVHELRMQQLNDEENAQIKELEKRTQNTPFSPAASTDWKPLPLSDTKKSGGSKRDGYESEVQAIRKRIEMLQAEAEAQQGVNPLIDDYGFAVEKAAAKQSLLNAAKQAGKTITPELAAEIEKLAEAYANGVVVVEQLTEKQDDIRRKAEEMRDFNKDVTRSIADGWLEGKRGADLFASALDKIKNKLLDSAFDSLFNSKSSGGSGLLDGLFNFFFHANGGIASGGRPMSLPLFAGGGVTRSAAIFGEAGPEAAVPLPDGRRIPVDLRMPSLPYGNSQSAAPVTIVVNNNSSARVETQETTDERGGRRIQFVMEDQMASGLTRTGSAAGKAMRNTYGVGPRITKR